MITVKNLTYRYPNADQTTLHGLDFELAKQEIFGFLGPSGAGKSTTQKILINLLKGYGGTAEVMGREVSGWGQDYFEHVGVSFELPNHYLKLSALENLNYFRSLYSGDTADPYEVLEWVGLAEDGDKRVADYSKGMKIRLNVARSLIHRPKLLFLDEPTSGLDPVNARRIKDLILELRSRGTTVFVTTHDMVVADELCDRVAFITGGTINLIDAPTALKKAYGKRTVQVEYLNGSEGIMVQPPELVEGGTGFDKLSLPTESKRLSKGIQSQTFPLDGLGENQGFINLLQTANVIETIHTQESTLEKIFIQVTGQELTT